MLPNTPAAPYPEDSFCDAGEAVSSLDQTEVGVRPTSSVQSPAAHCVHDRIICPRELQTNSGSRHDPVATILASGKRRADRELGRACHGLRELPRKGPGREPFSRRPDLDD